MCGIIGYVNHGVTKEDMQVLKQVFLESRIRGKHASGLAWFDGHKIQSYVKPIPIDVLLEDFDLSKTIYKNREIAIIGHTRYSTSDIKYNQPLVGNEVAIAHNGVISQDSPENWKKLYGYKCKTKNDSELLLRALEQHDDPMKKFPRASIAAVVLNMRGQVYCLRNELRPVWQGTIGYGVVMASTYDILHRAGVKNIQKVEYEGLEQDLQRRDITQWTPRN